MEAKTLALYLGCETNLGTLITVKLDEAITSSKLGGYVNVTDFSQLKLLLRPLSSMTEEEALEWNEKFRYFAEGSTEQYVRDRLYLIIQTVNENRGSNPDKVIWLLSKGFDLFGLIEKGEAIDSTKI